jgi:hypothetical protein
LRKTKENFAWILELVCLKVFVPTLELFGVTSYQGRCCILSHDKNLLVCLVSLVVSHSKGILLMLIGP